MSRPRAIPVETLAFAYELRQEYGICWRDIGKELQTNGKKLCDAVNHAIRLGVNPWRT